MNSRARIISENLESVVSNLKWNEFLDENDERRKYTDQQIKIIKSLFFETEEDYKLAEQLANNKYQRKKRYRKYIKEIIKEKSYFVTFTLDEESIKHNITYLRKRLTEILKKNYKYYIANIDYGKTTERLHFHAIIRTEEPHKKIWKYGFSDWLEITIKNDDRLAKYINKLTNHALKDETKKRYNIIVSRNREDKKNKKNC